MILAEYCFHCGFTRRQHDTICPRCACETWRPALAGQALARTPEAKGRAVGGLLGERVVLPPGSVVLLHGPPGVGKTTFAIEMMGKRPKQRSAERPWVVATESPPRALRDLARRVKARVYGIGPAYGPAEVGGEWGLGDEAAGRDLVVDSLSASGDPDGLLLAVRTHCRDHAVNAVCTVQHTKDGKYSGSAALKHDCDVAIELRVSSSYREAVIEKNRHGAEASVLWCWGEGGRPALPVWSGHYSIEGNHPRYRVAAYPFEAGPLADPYRHAEKNDDFRRRLPAAPVAMAARASGLVAGGFAEPEDVADRARFAEQYGLPFARISEVL